MDIYSLRNLFNILITPTFTPKFNGKHPYSVNKPFLKKFHIPFLRKSNPVNAFSLYHASDKATMISERPGRRYGQSLSGSPAPTWKYPAASNNIGSLSQKRAPSPG